MRRGGDHRLRCHEHAARHRMRESERARRPRQEVRRRGPFLLHDAIVIGGGGGGGVDGGECASASDEFDELVVITRQPLLPKRSG
jgi:hypothetical protein